MFNSDLFPGVFIVAASLELEPFSVGALMLFQTQPRKV